MSEQVYEIGCGLELLDGLHKDTATLVILDLPYYGVVDEDWDKAWKSLDDYLDWCKEWFIKAERCLKDNGSLYYFNSQYRVLNAIDDMVLSKTSMRHRQHITIDKGWQSACSYHGVNEGIRSYPAATEFCNWYTFQDGTGLTKIMDGCVFDLREYIRNEIIRAKGNIIFKEINSLLGTATNGGGVASAVLSLNKSVPAMITEEHYIKLQKWLNCNGQDYEYLRKDYEDLRKDYEDLRYPFNYQNTSYDVWHFDFYKDKRHSHPTQKPFGLIERIVLTSSNEDDLVIDPAMGTGTTYKVCKSHNRNFRGRELNSKYESDIFAHAMPATPTLNTYQ